MQITLIGIIVYLFGSVILFRGRIVTMLAFVLLCSLVGGSAAMIMTSLGGSSIPPGQLALFFLCLRIMMQKGALPTIHLALRANIWFILFAAYGVAGAMILPRIFAGKIDVAPMKIVRLQNLLDSFPLAFSSQNITTAFYIVGSALFAIFTFVAVRQPGGAVRVVKISTIIALVHAGLGFASVMLPHDLWLTATSIFRNGSYAQTDQSIGGFIRMSGIMPEPSSYAAFAFCWFVFMVELWLRDINGRWTGCAAAALAAALIISTSSTAYACMAIYALILIIRLIIFPGCFTSGKVAWLVSVAAITAIAVALLMAVQPALAAELIDLLAKLTVEKGDSESGLQRAFWARQGFDAFYASYGLGVGPGSFRSSSNVTAIIGSMGVIGCISFCCYLVMIFGPLRNSTYMAPLDPVDGVGVAASWAAIGTLIVGALISPTPDPGTTFAMFAGIALSLRSLRVVWVATPGDVRIGPRLVRRVDPVRHVAGA